jgi:hypothetical protein
MSQYDTLGFMSYDNNNPKVNLTESDALLFLNKIKAYASVDYDIEMTSYIKDKLVDAMIFDIPLDTVAKNLGTEISTKNALQEKLYKCNTIQDRRIKQTSERTDEPLEQQALSNPYYNAHLKGRLRFRK